MLAQSPNERIRGPGVTKNLPTEGAVLEVDDLD